MLNNRKRGNTFEAEFCDLLFDAGFWVHNLAQNSAGQPADVIAVVNTKAFLIDCKLCTGDYFSKSRIEPNQKLAMETWLSAGNLQPYFAVKYEKTGNIYLVQYMSLERYDKNNIPEDEIRLIGIPLDSFIKTLAW